MSIYFMLSTCATLLYCVRVNYMITVVAFIKNPNSRDSRTFGEACTRKSWCLWTVIILWQKPNISSVREDSNQGCQLQADQKPK